MGKRGGIIPQRKGESFENTIQLICDSLRNREIAWIDKKETQKGFNKITKQVFYKKESTVDFEGFMENGKHICFEVKNIQNKSSWTFANKHQIKYLYDAWISGCISFLLISAYGDRVFKAIPSHEWKDKKSIKINFVDEIPIPWDGLYDFIVK